MLVVAEVQSKEEGTATRVVAYVESKKEDPGWLGSFTTEKPIDLYAPTFQGQPENIPEIVQRLRAVESRVVPVQLQENQTQGSTRFEIGGKQISIDSRPGTRQSSQNLPTGETVFIFNGRVTFSANDVSVQNREGETYDLGTVSLTADRLVFWIPSISGPRPVSEGDGELYLEGNIVFRQGNRFVYAQRMYYNVRRSYGVILQAEIITPIPDRNDQLVGFARIKADAVQQISKEELRAYGTAVTTSRLGVPRYWLQSGEVTVDARPGTAVDPITGTLVPVEQSPLVRSRNNLVYLGGVPVFYWPTLSSRLDKPTFYLAGVKVNNDRVFGQQVMLDWDLSQLLGLENLPDGTEWTLSTDYFSERGFALGTQATYNLTSFLGFPGPVIGSFDAWGIDDSGLDLLGSDRQNLVPESDPRGRALLRHRHYLPNDTEFWADLGFQSDRNFLEQYLENEWDQGHDQTTGLRLRKYALNQLLDLEAQVRVNDFYTQTNWLPRLNHYLLGASLLGDRLTWSAKSHVGYAKLETASTPTNAADAAKFAPLAWEVEREGIRAGTRQELALPLELGPVKVVPFVSGDATFWGETVGEQQVTRLTGQTGVRTSLPMWSAYPGIVSPLLNINGLAHKVEWRGDLLFAESDKEFADLPLYDQLDDDAQEHFRRRFFFNTFGTVQPPEFDERRYALRHGLQGSITSPSTEIADDLFVGRLGLHQRWQTKRGLMGRERITDLVKFDVDLLLFPREDRDNFGESIGPALYDFRYHIGDRLSFLSDGYFDFFTDGLRSVSGGLLWSRPALGDVYLGILSLEGPISSTTLRGTVNYRLDDKWIVNANAAVDLGETGNIGQQFNLIRVGESMLVRVGLAVDAGRDNVSFQFGIEPRIWPKKKYGRLGGVPIPPPGVESIE
jgi:hypothetical protein